MIFLAFSIICSVSIAHLFRYAEEKTLPMFGIFAVNYCVGTIGALWGGSTEFFHLFSLPLFWLGAIVGGLFVCSFILMRLTIKKLGVTIPVSLMRLSAVLPTFGSIIFFSEIPQNFQIVGIALAFLSLPLASGEQVLLKSVFQVFDEGIGWGFLLFGVFGISNFIFKIQRELFPLQNPFHFLCIIFPVAFMISVIIAIYQRTAITKAVLTLGVILGLLNLFSNYFFMKALQNLPGIVVYPTNGIGIILLSAMTSIIFWKERLTRVNYSFIALASLALLLIYPH